MKQTIQKSLAALLLMFSFAFLPNPQSAKAQTHAALGGYCPVAYAAMNKAVKGDSKYSSSYKGNTYYFSSADAKKMFDASPKKYLPKYNGYCATAMSMGQKTESNPELFTEYKGNTYLFSSQMAKDKFDANPEMIISGADKEFAKLKS